jgi:glycosyltransferase involved in cell wall biosynthesis
MRISSYTAVDPEAVAPKHASTGQYSQAPTAESVTRRPPRQSRETALRVGARETMTLTHGLRRDEAALRKKTIWVTWERHRRTREIAQTLEIPVVELISSSRGLKRYAQLLLRTTLCLVKERPAILVVQCPSVILGLWTLLLKPLLGYSLVADLHNEAVAPFINRRARVYGAFVRLLHRAADLSLVTNPALVSVVEANGGRSLVLPDRVPAMTPFQAPSPAGPPYPVVFVCSFSSDEPYHEVIKAAELLTGLATLYVTGSVPRDSLGAIPPNVHLTGYLPEAAYEQLLRDAVVVVDLTAIDDCLVCGAYEAVALQKPLVTSDTRALRAYFRRGAVYTRHDSESIAAAIRAAIEARVELSRESGLLRGELETEWEPQRAAVVDAIRSLGSARRNNRASSN